MENSEIRTVEKEAKWREEPETMEDKLDNILEVLVERMDRVEMKKEELA